MASEALEHILVGLKANATDDPRTAEQWRAELDAQGGAMVSPEGVSFEAADADGVPAEWITPENAEPRTLIYLHGGGYVCGSLDSHRTLAANLAIAGGCRVINVAYRLAPEHTCPAAIEDVTTVYRWLLAQDIDAANIAIAGDSAGGGLTIATLVALRDAGDPLPARGVLICPWTDLTLSGESIQSLAEDELIARLPHLQQMSAWYAGDGDPSDPQASPLFADLAGLPPILVHAGGADILVDDGRRMVANLKAAGVEAELDEWPEMIHVWHAMAPILPEGMEAVQRIGAFLRG